MSLFDPEEIKRQEWLQSVLDRLQRFLLYRDRSRKEIETRLLTKKLCQKSEVEGIMQWLDQLGFINEQRFARNRLQYRMGRGYGPRYISQELGQLGIARQDVHKVLAEVDPGDYFEHAQSLARRKLSSRPQFENQQELNNYLYAYLGNRGFNGDTIRKVLDEIRADFLAENLEDY